MKNDQIAQIKKQTKALIAQTDESNTKAKTLINELDQLDAEEIKAQKKSNQAMQVSLDKFNASLDTIENEVGKAINAIEDYKSLASARDTIKT